MRLAPQELRTYSVTAVADQRRRVFQTTRNARLMLDHLQEQRVKGRFELHAFVVMPDHLHVLLTPAPDVALEKAIQFIKGGYSFRLKSPFEIWNKGYYERRIVDAEAFDTCKRYIEQNPIRKMMVVTVQEFPYSSASRMEMLDPRPAWFG